MFNFKQILTFQETFNRRTIKVSWTNKVQGGRQAKGIYSGYLFQTNLSGWAPQRCETITTSNVNTISIDTPPHCVPKKSINHTPVRHSIITAYIVFKYTNPLSSPPCVILRFISFEFL